MRFVELVPRKVTMEAPVVASVILNTESSRENSVIEKNEQASQEHLIGSLECNRNNNNTNSCSPDLDRNPSPQEDDSDELENVAAAAASLEACSSVEDLDQCKTVPESYISESSIIVRNESVIFPKSNDMLCNISLSAKNRNHSEIIKSPMLADKVDETKHGCGGTEDDELSSDTDGLSQDNLHEYSNEIKHTIVKDEDHIMRCAPVICMAPSLSHSGYGLPGGQGLPPVSTIIRSTARFDKSLSSLSNATHLSHIDHNTNVSLPEMIEMNVMQLIPSNALTPSDLSVAYTAQRSVVVSAPSEMDMSSVILNMSQHDQARMLQKDLPSNMDHLENNGHHMDNIRYQHHSDELQHSKYLYDPCSYELTDSVHSDINEHDIHDDHPMLSVAEAKNLIVASETKHFSSDEGSNESPLLTVDSDMEVQDLTHRINSTSGVNVKPTLHGMPTGVITSSIRNLGMVDLPRNNSIQKIIDDAEAEDLSNRVKLRSMDMNKNSDLDASIGISTGSSLQGLSQSVLPSFLSSLANTSLASLSASLSGMPISGITTSNSSNVQSSLMGTPTSVLLSSIMPNPSLLSVKPEPSGNSSESSQSLSPDASPITTSSNSVYSSLPSVSSTFTSLIKQEMNTPSCGPLPPFPVISGLHALKRTEASGNVSSSASVFASSNTQLPPYSSMRIPPSVTIPTSPSSDSPASSPVGVPSDSLKKNEQFKEVSSSSLTPKNDGKDGKWCCLMCRNGSPCGLHPTQAQVSTSAVAVSNLGPLPSGDPAKPYQCNLCGKNLASKNVYQLHMRSHSGEKPFRCNLCGHNFSQKTSLTRHMRSHTGERPFPCGVCGKRFADKERIKIHMRTHTGEKPFACEVCGKRFSQKSTVKRHMSVHTGEKPFKCDLCGKGFANRGNLNAHAKTHANS